MVAALAAASTASPPVTSGDGLWTTRWWVAPCWFAASEENERSASRKPASSAPRVGPSPLRVLIVEDNVDAAHTLRDLLLLLDYEVQVAYTGDQGVERALAFLPDVILCDLGLPGLDGYQVAAFLRPEPTLMGVRLIAITGYSTEEDRCRSQEAGFETHLVKPVDLDVLEGLLASAAAQRDRGPQRH